MGQLTSVRSVIGIAATALLAAFAGTLANALFGNLFAAILAVGLIVLVAILASNAGAGWPRTVTVSLLFLIVVAFAYAAFVFWWNYG